MRTESDASFHDTKSDATRGSFETKKLFSSASGMATLADAGLEIFNTLDGIFLQWAAENKAQSFRYPALIRVEDLDCLNYFHNFPHLVLCACAIDESAWSTLEQRSDKIETVNHKDLQNVEFCLPPAACYNVYLGFRGQQFVSPQYVTTVASCFRNENHYDGLQRLRNFTLREMICVGTAGAVRDHLQKYKSLVTEFLDHLGLPVSLATASDPFFDKQGTAARAARIFPTKEEILYRDKLAIGSINYHRRFFGERCQITVSGEPAHTGCIGFGMERWIHALAEHFGSNAERILAALASAQQKQGQSARRSLS